LHRRFCFQLLPFSATCDARSMTDTIVQSKVLSWGYAMSFGRVDEEMTMNLHFRLGLASHLLLLMLMTNYFKEALDLLPLLWHRLCIN